MPFSWMAILLSRALRLSDFSSFLKLFYQPSILLVDSHVAIVEEKGIISLAEG